MKREQCFDMGAMQAFIDGELSSGQTEGIIRHVALCDECARLLAETEEENALAFAVLDEQLNCLVPTERLRTKVLDSIREIESKENWWNRLAAFVGPVNGFGFGRPGLVAFAGVVLFVGMLAVGLRLYQPLPGTDAVAVSDRTEFSGSLDSGGTFIEPVAPAPAGTANGEPAAADEEPAPERTVLRGRDEGSFRAVRTAGTGESRAPRTVRPRRATYNPDADRTADARPGGTETASVSPDLSGEDSYLQTIDTLSRSVENSKEMLLRPTERVAFERDMAVVDDAIKKMKQEVRKNPNNQAAREVLRSSYQNKIDLLNSVAERNELMASIN